MTDMKFVEEVIDDFIDDLKERRDKSDCDALDLSYYRCSIGTLELLKKRLGLNK